MSSWLWGSGDKKAEENPKSPSSASKSPKSAEKTEMRTVTVSESFPKMNAKEVFDLVFGKELVVAYQESQGNKNVEVSDWAEVKTEDENSTQMERTLKYTVPMNVPLPKMMADSMGMIDTIANSVETAVLKDGVYSVTAVCVLTGPPMCNKVDIKPLFLVKTHPDDESIGFVECNIQFAFNVWGLSSMVESTMETGVKKGFEDLLKMAKTWATDGKPPAKESK